MASKKENYLGRFCCPTCGRTGSLYAVLSVNGGISKFRMVHQKMVSIVAVDGHRYWRTAYGRTCSF